MMSSMGSDSDTMKIISFNCHGFKSSLSYVKELYCNSDIMFLCEHWLQEGELKHVIKDIPNVWSNLKSSIDPRQTLMGRPYGGCGFICKNIPGMVFNSILCDSDRISGIDVIVDKQIVMKVFGLYLPYDSNSKQCLDSYLETLHELQGHVDNCGTTPYMVVGDFNTRLPMSKTLAPKWHNCNKFGKRSAILYDFLCENDLYVVNFAYKQTVSYTFHNKTHKSYIDHMLAPLAIFNKVSSCEILDSDNNVSDHNALYCVLELPHPIKTDRTKQIHAGNKVDWNKPSTQDVYCASLKKLLYKVPVVNTKDIVCQGEAEEAVQSTYTIICDSIHKAAEAVSESTPKHSNAKSWWNRDCQLAKERTRLFFRVWKDLGKPTSGQAYDCYKSARRQYRKICRNSVNASLQSNHNLASRLFKTKRFREFWNLVRRSKRIDVNSDAINLEQLEAHFRRKFDAPNSESEYTSQAKRFVEQKFVSLKDATFPELCVSEANVIALIKRLKSGCSPGIDLITPEHLKFSIGSPLTLHLSTLLTLCLRFGVVPSAFCSGLLVPILKKSSLDPCIAAHYRPITISVIISKLLELYILNHVSDFNMDEDQFGFVKNRGTKTAISLAHDISAFCHARGSSTFLCSLDAEAAFDAIPHSVLFHKASSALPDAHWRVLCQWYSQMTVQIKWANVIGAPIPVKRGTRQGGLSSPFLFNLFYKDLIEMLREAKCGVSIEGGTFNVYCYADDILLCSTTPTGLQALIDIAVSYIVKHGLRFNPTKTTCMVYGQNPFNETPVWHIQDASLKVVASMPYLGATLTKDGGKSHVENRIKAANRAYFSLQHAGLHYKGVSPDVAAHLFSVGIQSTLAYGCEAIHTNLTSQKELSKCQGNLLKASLGLRRSCHTTPLLKALNILPIPSLIGLQSLNLLKSNITYPSGASKFYCQLIAQRKLCSSHSLIDRVYSFATEYDIDVVKYILDSRYCSLVRNRLRAKAPLGVNGIDDSVRSLFCNYNDHARDMIHSLIGAF